MTEKEAIQYIIDLADSGKLVLLDKIPTMVNELTQHNETINNLVTDNTTHKKNYETHKEKFVDHDKLFAHWKNETEQIKTMVNNIPAGKDGATGPQGIQGIKGDTGPQGPKGDRGGDGEDGENVSLPKNLKKLKFSLSPRSKVPWTNEINKSANSNTMISMTYDNIVVNGIPKAGSGTLKRYNDTIYEVGAYSYIRIGNTGNIENTGNARVSFDLTFAENEVNV